jgi:hypothetical protein
MTTMVISGLGHSRFSSKMTVGQYSGFMDLGAVALFGANRRVLVQQAAFGPAEDGQVLVARAGA